MAFTNFCIDLHLYACVTLPSMHLYNVYNGHVHFTFILVLWLWLHLAKTSIVQSSLCFVAGVA